MTETAQMRTWAEISLDRLAHNYQTLRAMLAPDCRFLGLCKANAYGHGALQVGRKLEALGADMLAVACVDEAAELRRGGVTIPILCLGQTPPQLAELLLEHDVTQTVSDLETGRALARAAQAVGRTLKIHVKVDTGMTRLGFLWREGGERETAAAIAALSVSFRASGWRGCLPILRTPTGTRSTPWGSSPVSWMPGRLWKRWGSGSKFAIVLPARPC